MAGIQRRYTIPLCQHCNRHLSHPCHTGLQSPIIPVNPTVNGLLIPGHYVEQVTSPDILPPDFKNPYLYVPTHLCSQSFCSQPLFPNFFITFIY